MSKVHTLHKSAQPRNTISTRVRGWSMTLNNYMEAEIKNLQNLECAYVFQKEICPTTGTPHLQGYFRFKQPQTLTAMKKINSRAHWEPARKEFGAMHYCHKSKTRAGEIYTNIKKIKDAHMHCTVDDENFLFKNNFEKWKEELIKKSIQESMEDSKEMPDIIYKKLFPKGQRPL